MELVIGTTGDVGAMYQGGPSSSGMKAKRGLLFENIFWLDPNNELQPVLGKSYENLGDGKYSIEIFDYIYDSDGNHFTASDVVFSIGQYIKEGMNPGNYSTLIDYKATGEYTLELTYSPAAMGQFVTLCACVFCITEAAWENSPDGMRTRPVGTGGYNLVPEETIFGSVYVFNKRADYWQTDEKYINDRTRQTLDKITIKFIADVSTLAVALENGEIDVSFDIAPGDRRLFANPDGTAAPGWMILEGNALNNAFVHLNFNCGPDSPCQDINLRKAICYAIDAEAINYLVNGAFGKVCFAATNPGLIDADESMGNGNYFPYDVAKAKELLAKSSYKGEVLRVLVGPTEAFKNCATLVKQYCAEVGINIETMAFDSAQFRTINADETGRLLDFKIHGLTSNDDYVFRSLVELDVNAYSSGTNHNFIFDPVLQDLYDTIFNPETHSRDAVKALLDYVEDNCYRYGLYYNRKIFFGKDYITYALACGPDDGIYNCWIVNR
jgi:ABC-type transport system substrate-binding protein